MTAEEKIHAALVASETLEALVDDRIYALAAAQATEMPCVVYARNSTEGMPVLSGDSGFSRAVITIEAVDHGSGSWANVRLIAAAVRTALATVAVFRGQQDSTDEERELHGISQMYSIIEEV